MEAQAAQRKVDYIEAVKQHKADEAAQTVDGGRSGP